MGGESTTLTKLESFYHINSILDMEQNAYSKDKDIKINKPDILALVRKKQCSKR